MRIVEQSTELIRKSKRLFGFRNDFAEGVHRAEAHRREKTTKHRCDQSNKYD